MINDLHRIAELLRISRRVLFITGAGVSAESGIPTFRGATGAFADGLTEEGIPFEEVLSSTTFRKNPGLSWKYFFRLEQSLRGKQPNAAHQAIAALEAAGRQVWVATQNIDGLHQIAGSTAVIELHGNLRRVICKHCDYQVYRETFAGMAPLPLCPECGRVLRPDAVLYEEMLPESALELFELEQNKGFDLIFSVGTSSIFDYVAYPVMMAARRGIPTVEVNPEPTPLSDVVRFRFAAPAGEVLQGILEVVRGSTTGDYCGTR
ncbi:MAG: NAD-dependent deacylase [Verrucomicrobiota bacterium]